MPSRSKFNRGRPDPSLGTANAAVPSPTAAATSSMPPSTSSPPAAPGASCPTTRPLADRLWRRSALVARLDVAAYSRHPARPGAPGPGPARRWAGGGCPGALAPWVKQRRPFGKRRLEMVRRCAAVQGFRVLPKRWIVERPFGSFSESRRLGRDDEVGFDHSEAMLRICVIRIMVRRLAAWPDGHETHFQNRLSAECLPGGRRFFAHSTPARTAVTSPALCQSTGRTCRLPPSTEQ